MTEKDRAARRAAKSLLLAALPLLLLDDHDHKFAIPTTITLLLACTYLLITLTPLHPQ